MELMIIQLELWDLKLPHAEKYWAKLKKKKTISHSFSVSVSPTHSHFTNLFFQTPPAGFRALLRAQSMSSTALGAHNWPEATSRRESWAEGLIRAYNHITVLQTVGGLCCWKHLAYGCWETTNTVRYISSWQIKRQKKVKLTSIKDKEATTCRHKWMIHCVVLHPVNNDFVCLTRGDCYWTNGVGFWAESNK